MGYYVETAASGQGSASLGGLRDVSEIAAGLITLADVADVAGVAPVRRLHHQAWYGVGLTPGGGPFTGLELITWWKFHELENETTILNSFGHVLADTVYWDVRPGGVIFIEVDWP